MIKKLKGVKIPQAWVPVVEKVDVLVAGGGPAGLSAAISAARNGASTLLVERTNCLGGMATSGLVGPFMGTAGTNGGIFRELINRLKAVGGAKVIKDSTRPDSDWSFDAEVLKYTNQQMAEEAGVKFLFHTFVEDGLIKNKQLKGVFIANKGGRQIILADVIIDATGDGDVAAFAGAEFEKGSQKDGHMQALSLFFRVGGIDSSLSLPVYQEVKDTDEPRPNELIKIRKALEKARKAGEINLPEQVKHVLMGWHGSTIRDGEVSVNVDTVTGIDGTDPVQITVAEIESRKRVWELINFYRKYVPGYENCFLIDTGSVVGVRETRRIIGEYVLTKKDVLNARNFEDGIAKASFIVDLHDSGGNPCTSVPKSDWYEIPYRCLVPKGIDNLLVAGRCISSDREANGSLRIMATCMATGQAAGTAAALAIQKGLKPRQLEGKFVRGILLAQGADLERRRSR